MKRCTALLLAFVTLTCSALACASSTEVPIPKIHIVSPEPRETAIHTQTETAPTASPSGIPTSVVCREKPENSLPFRTWRNTDTPLGHYAVNILHAGPAVDSESLWVSTNRGLARLNVRTGQCDLLTQAAGVPLAGPSHVILPDDGDRFWIGAGEYLLHLSDARWQVAYKGEASITAIGLSQTGDLCLDMYKYYHRGFESYWLCFADSELPLPSPRRVEGCYGEDCHLHPTNCDVWQQMSSGGRRYTTPDECRRVQQVQTAFGPDDAEALVAFSTDGSEVWSVKNRYPENDLLFYQREGVSRQDEIPYRVRGLAADHVHGGVWLTTENELIHVEDRAAAGGEAESGFTFQPFAADFQVPSLDAGPFPGEARGLAIDKANYVWAVNGKSVLCYDEASESWREVVSPKGGADAIAADPAYGVWIAGRGELMHLDGTHRQAWPMPDTLTSAPTALLVDGGGRVWMGTTENGVWTAVPSSKPAGSPLAWRAFTAEDGLGSASITAMAQAPDGRIYAAHLAGISVFDPIGGIERGRWVTLPDSSFSEYGWVNALTFAPSGKLWAGTHPEGYLWRYDGSWADYSPAWYSSIGALLVDGESTLWVGANKVWGCGKLWYWSTAGAGGEPDWQALDPRGLTVCSVLSLAQDVRGRIWAGDREGVMMWEGER